MGAIHFSLDVELLKALRKTLSLGCFVETGTYKGDTSALASEYFDQVYTIELSKELIAEAAPRLALLKNVKPIAGSSPKVLTRLKKELGDKSVLYWLDAHWCGETTSGGDGNECPLMEELAAIGKLNDDSVILIDDARFFTDPPPAPHDVTGWPRLDQVVAGLKALSETHKLWIISDVFIFVPDRAEPDTIEYGRRHGANLWQLNWYATHWAVELGSRDARIRALEQTTQAALEQAARAGLAAQPATVSDNVVPTSFNQAFLSGERSEKILAYHLARMGITQLLDIGANTGQFGEKMRRYGYGGLIYSVEPQSAAWAKLVAAASEDLKWIPLLPQGVGADTGYVEINLSENSFSSSLLEVHANHLAAEPTTRTIARERIYTNKTVDLLRPEVMNGIEALKIDVQGYESKVLEGYEPLLKNIRLLLLELSMVECYKGAPDLFALDDHLVNKLGFSRISLEPSYYDDVHGVVQQYDGIYYRPDVPSKPQTEPSQLRIGAVVTSSGGPIKRQRNDGLEVGDSWLMDCMNSWMPFASRVVSVSELPPPAEKLTWLKTPTKPPVAELFRQAEAQTSDHVLLVNADVFLTDVLAKTLPALAPGVFYYGRRHEVHYDVDHPGSLVSRGYYPQGFDFFVMPHAFVHAINENKLIPETFLVGEPWWDYLLPLLSFAIGFPTKKFGARDYLALHYSHADRASTRVFLDNGIRIIECLRGIHHRGYPHAEAILAEMIAPDDNVHRHLERITNRLCYSLP